MNYIDQISFEDSDLDEGTVQMYERRLRNGQSLPAVVLRDNNGRYEVIDGFHRIAAMQRCGTKEIKGVYLVNIPTEGVPQLRRQLNRHATDCNGGNCDCASKRFTDFFRNRHNGPEEEIGGDDSEPLSPNGPWIFANPPYRNKKPSPTAVHYLDCGEQFYAEASITFKDVRIRKDEQ